ncbi:hypothetical protein [Pseudonocardia sp. NPDC049154]|uniref:hypothetical protein n=1 Tax=Pseudonocardia sp. NPDC049154 TaxID=3155501 RepID=UPI0033C2CA30
MVGSILATSSQLRGAGQGALGLESRGYRLDQVAALAPQWIGSLRISALLDNGLYLGVLVAAAGL